MAGQILTLSQSDGVAVAAPSAFLGFKEVGTGDYTANVWTVTDTDGYNVFSLTTSSTNRTLALPTLADNQGRVITVIKADSGTGYVLVDGESSETVNGAAAFYLTAQYESVRLIATSTGWLVSGFTPRAYTEAPCTTSLTTAADDYDAVPGCSITLQPGTWSISYQASGRVTTTTTSAAIVTAAIFSGAAPAANSTTGIVANSSSSCEWTADSTTSSSAPVNLSCSVVVSPTAQTTYLLCARSNTTTSVTSTIRTVNFNGGLTDPDGGTQFWARRIG